MPRKDLREKVYSSLRRDLISGAISSTERLGEERLAELYGVSRTPVREALARLQADGLVTRDEAGLHAYRPRIGDLPDLYELRSTLEARGITRSMSHPVDRSSLSHLLDTWIGLRADPPDTTDDLVSLDENFHVTLLAASGNPALTEALCTVNAKVRPVRILGGLTAAAVVSAIDQHIDIVERVLAGTLDSALELLLAHIDSSRDLVVERAEQAAALAGAVRM
ncbi:GntR family transcriptional regulator [Rhodococcus sp. 15-725-2-2b]|uniref:GntR family transcriptional regulator n=1 Tax=unclassified Rhodococcus (in: high G+C Gram-positive bacteria) TaxID=192944 RepID=UPI000B9AC511|nr:MULTISPECIES: GntR family transcriptional regulator [unclassified Rhodococcus (in: high G+C Gram-positive bacteria)]OZC56913.1 GntR family transcriptional regulator [Rhodococcus sp. 06-470-2]OZC68567.1 GntR family transcriptional regulator [Rhodococcus sp. 06-469-3-2]OZC73276.1 GntR family transcriptional regulator [Rhodococcus sp. 06-418-5]OZD45244.1 GntR family transcriptional regulator [Rhodococcus sp. 06-1477-1A]OZE65598.1 GntR family transcriptional regulator [Rhodococcus sp. 05-2221-1